MLYLEAAIILIACIYGPQAWIKYILAKHNSQLENMPGTGGEFARHLMDVCELSLVKVERFAKNESHYDPIENAIRLSPDVYSGKSLTAISIAAHEAGHAIQFNRKEAISFLRDKYLGKAVRFKRAGIWILMVMPAVAMVFGIPYLTILTIILGMATMLVSVLMHMAILPEEYDASFNKALPILDKGEYVPKAHLPAVRQILRACALTYVAAALVDMISLWRWIRLVR